MEKIRIRFDIKDFWKLLAAVSGTLIFSLGVNLFIVPAGLYNGGVVGIGQISKTVLEEYAHMDFGGINIAGIIYLMINIPLFVLAYHSLGERFFARTVVCVAAQTVFLTLIPIPQIPIVDDALTACLIGGIIAGAGVGTALRFGGSGGGLDILGLYYTKKYQDFSVGKMALFVNIVIYSVCMFLFDIKVVIYSVIYSAVCSIMVDKTHIQNICTEVYIFTKEEPAKIVRYILEDLGRGATYWLAKGGYTDQPTNIIYVVVSKHELMELKRRLHTIDPHAFVVSKEGVGIDGKFAKKL